MAIVGLGLIGGSIARALRAVPDDAASAAGTPSVAAWSPRSDAPRRAQADGVIDDAPPTLQATIGGADLVVLAPPPQACLRLLDDLAGELRGTLDPDATLTDVASTKAAIVGRADALGLPFVGGHPMAGREQAGFEASLADLFRDRPWVVVPGRHARPADVARVEWLARACGARPLRLTGDEHDAAVAAISHVPLVLSAALAGGVAGRTRDDLGTEWRTARGLAAGGWRDMTRLARGDAAMGAGIAATNRVPLARGLRLVRAEIEAWLAELESGDDPELVGRLERRLGDARSRLDGPEA